MKKLLGVINDNKLCFSEQVIKFCGKATKCPGAII